LHAFPIAGSQLGWGTFLLVPVLVAGLHEAWASLARDLPSVRPWVPRVGAGLLLAVTLVQLGLLAQAGWERYTTSRPLALPGSEGIRVEGPTRLMLRVMTLNAAVHADVLFSRPGMFSYNEWSGVRPPTSRNATHWFWLLDDADQQAIIAGLEATPRSAFIASAELTKFLEKIKVPIDCPLQSHLTAHYRTLFELGDFSFLVPTESRAVPFGRVELWAAPPNGIGGVPPGMLRSNLVLEGRPAAVTIERLNPPWTTWQDFRSPGCRAYLEPI